MPVEPLCDLAKRIKGKLEAGAIIIKPMRGILSFIMDKIV